MLTRRGFLRTGCGGGVAAMAGCAGSRETVGDASGSSDEIVVGSKTFAENRILGYMTYEALSELTDLQVVDEIGYGATGAAWEGLTEGALDLYWEYTGTLRLTHPPSREELITDPDDQAAAVRETVESEYDLTVLSRAPFNNTYTIVTIPDADRADETNGGVQEISRATDRQADAAQDVSSKTDRVAELAEDTADETEHVAAAAEEQASQIEETARRIDELADRVADLRAELDAFETGTRSAGPDPGRAGPAASDRPAAEGGTDGVADD